MVVDSEIGVLMGVLRLAVRRVQENIISGHWLKLRAT